MAIKDLIQRIVESTPPESISLFTFTLEDTNAKPREYVVDCRGQRFEVCEGHGNSVSTHCEFGVDDAVAFLFDCDTHLWELISYEIDMSMYGTSREWRIKLKR